MRSTAAALAAAALLLALHVSLAHAGAWTQPQGRVWLKSAFIYLLTEEQFAPNAAVLEDGTSVERGDSRPFDDGGTTRMRVIWNEMEYGLHDRVTLGAQVPFHDLRFEDRFQRTDSWGVGDLRFTGRLALLDRGHRLSARGAWKLPVGKAATNPDDVPLSEGQHDLEAGLQYGRSLGRPMSWLGVEAGHRWRLHEDEEGRDPGDEWHWRVEVGYAPQPSRPWAVRLAWDGLRGARTRYDDLGLLPGRREFDSLSGGLLLQWAGWMLEPGFSHTLAGEAFPSGTTLNLGLSREFQLRS